MLLSLKPFWFCCVGVGTVFSGYSGSSASLGGMGEDCAVLGMRGERHCVWYEGLVAAVSHVWGLGGEL